MNKYLRIGVITKPHGIRGEVKVYPTTDSPYRFDVLKHVILKKEEKTVRELDIEGVKHSGSQVILKFRAVDSIEEAERLRNTDIYIPREEGIPLEEGEYYIADLIDMEVMDETGRIGIIRDVLETGANDVYIVRRDDNGRDLLIPNIPDCILDVDIETSIMRVHLMDGLLDL